MNLIELLEHSASRWPHKPALIEGDTRVSYSQLLERAETFATQLRRFALPPGSRVGLSLPNSVAYVAWTFALWRIGVVVVPIPTECTAEESAKMASAMRLDAVLAAQPRGEESVPMADVFFTRLHPATRADAHGLNIAFIRFTSGTTSARKGVVLCHESIRDRVVAANKALRIGPEDTVVWGLPMSHHFLVTILLYLAHGATVALTRFVMARPILDAVNRWGGTVLYAAPFHYGLLARDASGAKLDSVRLAVSTTCSLPRDVAMNFHQRFGLPLTQALGVIELGLVCVNVDDPLGRWDSVGRPLPDFAVNILNPDADGYGEIAVSGPGLFDAYDQPWIERESLMPDGWFATGDIGRVDAEGFVFWAGRKVAVINLAGRKVFPEEIEAVLNRHPAVRESRVFGVPHAHLGETVEAEVAARDGQAPLEPDALRDFCRRQLSADKVPSRIRLVEAVAKTAVTGKLRRWAAPSAA